MYAQTKAWLKYSDGAMTRNSGMCLFRATLPAELYAQKRRFSLRIQAQTSVPAFSVTLATQNRRFSGKNGPKTSEFALLRSQLARLRKCGGFGLRSHSTFGRIRGRRGHVAIRGGRVPSGVPACSIFRVYVLLRLLRHSGEAPSTHQAPFDAIRAAAILKLCEQARKKQWTLL